MSRWQSRFWSWPALVAMAFCALAPCKPAVAGGPDVAVQLERTESLRTIDHPRFLSLLRGLHQQANDMSRRQRWYLRYLDAWQASFQGDYAHADPMLHDVIDHSGDSALVAKASAVLMDDLDSNKQYEQAFELANRVVAKLPETQDRLARYMVLSYASQLLRSAGQYDLAIKYVRDMAQATPPGQSPCQPMAILLAVRYSSHQLTSHSAELQQGIDTCLAAGEPVFADTIWLVQASLYVDEDQPGKAIALLQRIAPSIHTAEYYSNTLSFQVELAQAYRKLGNNVQARKAALAALASSDPDDTSRTLRDAYHVLYSVEKARGHAAAALAYYEHYVAQEMGHLNDVSARALAYDMAQQHMLAQKLDTEKLSKQNSILQLQQALANKAMETSRLFIALLLIVLASVVFWLARLKRSQLRFKAMSCLDGLTGVFNHQHFMREADRALRGLERKSGIACLVSIDLDHFKHVNDTHGHAVGDAVLKHTVAICRQHLRPADIFGRLGGEEFGILLLECTRDHGTAIADRIRIAIEATPVEIEGCVVSFSTSIGLTSTNTAGYVLQRLCRTADAALYRAKRTGRNRVVIDMENGNLAGA